MLAISFLGRGIIIQGYIGIMEKKMETTGITGFL